MPRKMHGNGKGTTVVVPLCKASKPFCPTAKIDTKTGKVTLFESDTNKPLAMTEKHFHELGAALRKHGILK